MKRSPVGTREEKRKMLKSEALERIDPEDETTKLPRGFTTESDAESEEEDDTLYTGMKDGKLLVRGKTLEQRLAKFVMEDNISVSSTKKMLHILREYGHEDLPTSKTTLVKENIDFSSEVMKVIKGIEKTLKAKLDFVMDQATRLESSLMLPDEAVESANYRHWSVNDKVGNTHIFPIASKEHFERIDQIFDTDSVLVRQVRDTILAFPTDWMRLLVADDVLCHFTISRSTDRRTIFSFKLFQYAQKLTNYHDVVHQFKIARDRHTKRMARKKKLEEQRSGGDNAMTPKQELVEEVYEETESN